MQVNQWSPGAHLLGFSGKKLALKTAILLASFCSVVSLQAQSSLWSPISLNSDVAKTEATPDLPDFEKGQLLQLDIPGLQNLGRSAQEELSDPRNTTAIIDLPLPDGRFQKFMIWKSPLMEPELAAKFPEISTYLLKGIDDPLARGRMSVSPDEFGAFFNAHESGQDVYIRKALKNSASAYLCYWGKHDPSQQQPFNCSWEGSTDRTDRAHRGEFAGPNETGDELRVFRLAMTIPGRLSENYGWTTKAQAMASLVAFLGQLNTIYERDLSVRFVLPVKQDEIIFLSAANDPFTALGGGEAANENLAVANQLIGQEGFDVGLIFVTGACCAAGKPTICGDYKAYNFSAFYSLRVTAHEIGHQFDADHTWTSCGPSNNGQFGTNEYGSGTSIMSYANICGIDNILPVGEETYFGVYSQIQMTNHIKAQTCYKTLATGNHIPVSTIPASGFYIPISTPFELVGEASDVDGDPLTYSWEQVNIRNIDFTSSTISIQTPPTPADGNVPIARIFNPTTSPRRTIPQLSDLLSNTSSVNERLPTYSRNIKYRMYVRDNHPGAGGTTHEELSFEVDGSAGPFLVSSPNTCVSWQAGSNQMVTWEVANTDNAIVNCQQVKISLSIDGGYHYTHILASSTPNDGAEMITLPAGICSNQSRIKIEAVGNIFFDISNVDFNIETNGTPIVKANALQLDGSDDQVEIQNASLGNFGAGNFTLEMWAQTTDNNCALLGKRAVCNCDNFWNFFIENGRLKAELSASNTCSEYLNVVGNNNTLANGNWHHIAFVRNGNALRFYVDGVLDLTVPSSQNFDNPAKITLGSIVCQGQNFGGSMDEIRIWNVARSSAEINEKMNCSLLGNETGLLAYYPINSQDCGICSAGTNALTDQTANQNHGLLQNGARVSLSTINLSECPNCANGPVSILSNPINQSVAVGETATFTTIAAGNNLSYQWYRSANAGATFTEIVGATQAEYALTLTNSGQIGWQFKCLVSNGCDLEMTTAATLSSTCLPQTLTSITGPENPCNEHYYTYFVTPNPNILSWSWSVPAGWSVATYDNMIFVKTAANAGVISVTGTDACGIATAAQTMMVNPLVVAFTTQPVSQTVNQNAAIEFSVSVLNAGSSTTYLWQESSDGGENYSNIAGANAATYAIPSVGLAQDQRHYRCIIDNACLRDTSEVAILQVNCTTSAPDAPVAILGGELICPSSSLTYSIAPVPGATSYLWTLPSGWIGNSSTTSINVSATDTGGGLSVQAINGCGISNEQVLPVSINSGPCRRGVHFDGINDHLAIAQNGQALSNDLTISFWVKPDALSGEQTMIFNGREFIIGLTNSQIRYKHSDDCCGYDNTVDMVFPNNLELGKWSHVAITRGTANRVVSFYLNGNFVQSQTYNVNAAQPGDHTTDLILGAGKNGAWVHFDGAMDEIKIWETIRTPEELKEDLVCSPTGNEPYLKAYYDFEIGQPFGDNPAISGFSNLASAYGIASVQNMQMSGAVSNIIAGDLPSFLFQDMDGDGFGGEYVGCNYTGPTVANSGDCDDQNSSINPNIIEICNGIDDDCSGIVDDILNVVASNDIPVPVPAGQTITSTLTINTPITTLTDLNVLNLDISHIWIADLEVRIKSPQGTESTLFKYICGDQDDMLINFDDEASADYGTFPCPPVNNGTYKPLTPLSVFDGENPNGTWTLTVSDVYEDAGILNAWSIAFPSTPLTFYADSDGDGFGNAAVSIQACTALQGYVANATDCDDNNSAIYPGATEICNTLDDDCNGLIDEAVGPIWYQDADADGYGNATTSIQACDQPSTFVANAEDCDDNNAQIYPGATEICNTLDDDCNGLIDEAVGPIWYQDADADGYGNATTSLQACDQPSTFVANAEDCDDNNGAIYPGAGEIANGLDDDCNGIVDDTLFVSSVRPIVDHSNGQIQLSLLPNPTSGLLHIVFKQSEYVSGTVEILNPIGQRVFTQDIQVEQGKPGILHLEHLPQGNYFLIFRREDGARTGERFMILSRN